MDSISALMDGELDGPQAEREIARLKSDIALREYWATYHVIGDAMRGQAVLSSDFSSSLSQRLAAEPTVLSPYRSSRQFKRSATYALSAAASLVAVAFVAWVAVGPNASVTQQATLTPAVAPVQAGASLASVSSDGHMNEYLLAHQGFSPSTAIQGLAPYIRSVSATRTPEGR